MVKYLGLLLAFLQGLLGWHCGASPRSPLAGIATDDAALGYIAVHRSEFIAVVDLEQKTHRGNIHAKPQVLLESIALAEKSKAMILRPHTISSQSLFLLDRTTGAIREINPWPDKLRHYIDDIKFLPDGKHLLAAVTVYDEMAVASVELDVLVLSESWDSLRILEKIAAPDNIKKLGHVAISADGHLAAVVVRTHGTFGVPEPILIFDYRQKTWLGQVLAGSFPFMPVFASDSRHLFVPTMGDRSMVVIDALSLERLCVLSPSFVDSAWATQVNIGPPVLSPDGNQLYYTFSDVASDLNGLVRVDISKRKIVDETMLDFDGLHLAFGRDPQIIYMTTLNREIVAFDLKEKKKVGTFSFDIKGGVPTRFLSSCSVE